MAASIQLKRYLSASVKFDDKRKRSSEKEDYGLRSSEKEDYVQQIVTNTLRKHLSAKEDYVKQKRQRKRFQNVRLEKTTTCKQR